MKTNFSRLSALTTFLGAVHFAQMTSVVHATCPVTGTQWPKVIAPTFTEEGSFADYYSTGESKITAITYTQSGSNFYTVVGGHTVNPMTAYSSLGNNAHNQFAFVGVYLSGNRWLWRLSFEFEPGVDFDATVAGLAVRPDGNAVAAHFVSASGAAGSDSYFIEFDIENGKQTSQTKLKVSAMTWPGTHSTQSIVYLDNNILLAGLGLEKGALTQNYIAALDFTKMAADQTSIIKLDQGPQKISQLTRGPGATDFYVASKVMYIDSMGAATQKNGIRFVKYNYDRATNAVTYISNDTKVILRGTLFDQTDPSTLLTAFRLSPNGSICGAVFSPETGQSWIFTFKDGYNSRLSFQDNGVYSKIFDCQESGSEASARMHFLMEQGTIYNPSQPNNPISVSVYYCQASYSTLNNLSIQPILTTGHHDAASYHLQMTAGVINSASPTQALFAVMNRDLVSDGELPHHPAAIYSHGFAGTNYQACASRPANTYGYITGASMQTSTSLPVQSLLLTGNQENNNYSSANIASPNDYGTQTIANSNIHAHFFSFNHGHAQLDDLCSAEDRDMTTTNPYDPAPAANILVDELSDYTSVISYLIGSPKVDDGAGNPTCDGAGELYTNFFIEAFGAAGAWPASLLHWFDQVDGSLKFKVSPDHTDTSLNQIYPFSIDYNLPQRSVKEHTLSYPQLTVRQACHAEFNMASYSVPSFEYSIHDEELTVFKFPAFPSTSACASVIYTLQIQKANGDVCDFPITGTSNTHFNFIGTPVEGNVELSFKRKFIDETETAFFDKFGDYVFKLRGKITNAKVDNANTDITQTVNFKLKLSCKNSPIVFNQNQVTTFTNQVYYLLQPFADQLFQGWEWNDVNVAGATGGVTLPLQRKGRTGCGTIKLYVLNDDASPIDTTLFHFSDQTKFYVQETPEMQGTALVQDYNLAVYFAYEADEANSPIDPYFTNKQSFTIKIQNKCKEGLSYYIAKYESLYTYYFDPVDDLVIPITDRDLRINWNFSYCPWKVQVQLYNSEGTLMESLPSAVTINGDPSVYLRATPATGPAALRLNPIIELKVKHGLTSDKNLATEGTFQVKVTYLFAYDYETGETTQTDVHIFDLKIINCASMIKPADGLAGASVNYSLTSQAVSVLISPQILENTCGEDWNSELSLNSGPGRRQLGSALNLFSWNKILLQVEHPQNDQSLIGAYTFSAQYTWNKGASVEDVQFTVNVYDKCWGALSMPTVGLTNYKLRASAVRVSLGMNYKPDNTNVSPTVTYTDCQFSTSYVSGIPQSIWETGDTVALERFDQLVSGTITVPKFKLQQTSYNPQVVGVYDVTVQYTWALGTATQSLTFQVNLYDECATALSPPSLGPYSYTLYDPAIPFQMQPVVNVGSPPNNMLKSICAYKIRTTSVIPVTLTLPFTSEHQDTKPSNIVSAQVFYEGAYSTEHVGTKIVTFEYTWSKDSSATLTITLNIADNCGSAFTPPTPPAEGFKMTVAGMNSAETTTPALTGTVGSPDLCTYTVSFVSATKAGDATNYRDNAIWVWQDKQNIRDATVPFRALWQNYDANLIGDFVVKLQYEWSTNKQDVDINVQVQDPCSGGFTFPSSIQSLSYTALSPKVKIPLQATITPGLEFCTYSAVVTILDANGDPIDISTHPAFNLEPSNQATVGDNLALSVYMDTIDPALIGNLQMSVQFTQGGQNVGSPLSFGLESVNPCAGVTPIASNLENQMYKAGATAKTYTVPAFSMSPSACPPLTYSYSSSDSTKTDPIVAFDSLTRTFTFDGTTDFGDYTLTVTGANPATPSETASASFTLKVVEKYCDEASFVFQTAVFGDRTYNFPLDPLKYEWTPPLATGDLDAQCGSLKTDIQVVQDGSSVAISASKFADLFTLDKTTGSLTVKSGNNRNHIGTHNLVVKAWYDGFTGGQHSFRVTVDSSLCDATELTTSGFMDEQGASIETINFALGGKPLNLRVIFSTGIKDCPLKDMRVTSDKGEVKNMVDLPTYRAAFSKTKIQTIEPAFTQNSQANKSSGESFTTMPTNEVESQQSTSIVDGSTLNGGRLLAIAGSFDNAPPKDVSLVVGENLGLSEVGTHLITITATLVTSVSATFKLVIADQSNCKSTKFVAPTNPKSVSYTSGQKAASVYWDRFSHDLPFGCQPDIKYSLSVKRIGPGSLFTVGMIDFQPFFNRLSIEGTFQDSGLFEVFITGELTDDGGKKTASINFNLELVGDNQEYSAVTMDPVMLFITTKVHSVPSPNFLAKDIISFEVQTADPKLSYNHEEGQWVLSDDWDYTKQKTVEVTLTYRSSANPNKVRTQTFQVSISGLGKDDNDEFHPIWVTDSSTTARSSGINSTRFSGVKPEAPYWELEKVDQKGFVHLVCDRDIDRVWDWNKTFLEEAFNLKILKGVSYSHRHHSRALHAVAEEIVGFDWDYVDFYGRTLLLRLNFSDPLLISIGLDFDTLEVTTNATLVNNLFRVQNSKFEEDQTLDKYIPVQLKNESEAFIKAVPVVGAIQAVMMMSIGVLNIILVGSTVYFWVMVNYLQLIVHLPMYSVNFPANAQFFLQSISPTVTFKFFEPTKLFDFIDEQVFNRFPTHEVPNPLFAEVGYGYAKSVMRNQGLVSVLTVGLFFTVLSFILTWRFFVRFDFCKRVLSLVWYKVFWSGPIRFALETYLGYTIATLIAWQKQEWGTWEGTMNSWRNNVLLFSLFFLPFWISYTLTKNWSKLENAEKDMEFYYKFRILYRYIDIKHEVNLLCHFVFCLRRFVFGFMVVFFTGFPVMQLNVLLLLSAISTNYLVYYRPYNNKALFRLEVFNEIILLLAIYHMFLFTNYVGSTETQYLMGYSFCAVIAFSLLINLGVLLWDFIFNTLPEVKRQYTEWRVDTQSTEHVPLAREIDVSDLPDPQNIASSFAQDQDGHEDQALRLRRELDRERIRLRSRETAEMIMRQQPDDFDIDHPKLLAPDPDDIDGSDYSPAQTMVNDLEMQSRLTPPASPNGSAVPKHPGEDIPLSSFKQRDASSSLPKDLKLIRDFQMVAQSNKRHDETISEEQ